MVRNHQSKGFEQSGIFEKMIKQMTEWKTTTTDKLLKKTKIEGYKKQDLKGALTG